MIEKSENLVVSDAVHDRYNNFAELASENVEGVDYKIILEDRGSDFVVVGIHGGQIEIGTENVVSALAGKDLSFYIFLGNERTQHITSSHFDEKQCVDLVSKSNKVISVHGKKGQDEFIMLGGLDKELISKIRDGLDQSGFKTIDVVSGADGVPKDNICNRGLSGSGVQLEMSRGLRDALIKDEDKMKKFVRDVRSSIAQ